MNNYLSLSSLELGQKAQVETLELSGTKRRRMLDLGFVSGSVVEAFLKSPSGDPKAYLVKGAVITLRREDAKNILIKAI